MSETKDMTAREQLLKVEQAGYDRGWEDAMTVARKGYRTLRIMQYIIMVTLGILISLTFGNIVHAQGVETTVTVQITAEVKCNPENCHDVNITDAEVVETEEPERGWWWTIKHWLLGAW